MSTSVNLCQSPQMALQTWQLRTRWRNWVLQNWSHFTRHFPLLLYHWPSTCNECCTNSCKLDPCPALSTQVFQTSIRRNWWALWRLDITYWSPLDEKRKTSILVSTASSRNCIASSQQRWFTSGIKRFS
jgi:hypothetical protein